MRNRLASAAASLALIASLAACSSNSKPTQSAAAGSGSSSALTGAPIRLGTIIRPLFDFGPPGAKAAIARINAEGGIHGRPLELDVCVNQDNANVAAACGTKYASDSTLIATVGDNNSFGADVNPTLTKAQVAGIGTAPVGAGDYASPRVFPNNTGGLIFLAGGGFLLDKGLKKIGMVTADTPTAQALPQLVDSSVFAPRGAKLAGKVALPATAADVSPQAASLVATEGQILALPQSLALSYMAASAQQGFKGVFAVSEPGNYAFADYQKALPAAVLANTYGFSWYDKSSKGYKQYLADLKKYQPQAAPNDLSAGAWLSVQTFADVARGLPEVTRQGVWDAMTKLKNYDTQGMTAKPLDYTVKGTALGGNAPTLVPSVLFAFVDKYENGTFVHVSGQPPVPEFH